MGYIPNRVVVFQMGEMGGEDRERREKKQRRKSEKGRRGKSEIKTGLIDVSGADHFTGEFLADEASVGLISWLASFRLAGKISEPFALYYLTT